MPGYWKWFSYINFLRYGWGAHMVNSFKDGRTADGSVPVFGGQPVLEYFGLEEVSKWRYVGYESLFCIVFFFATWATLQFRTFSKR